MRARTHIRDGGMTKTPDSLETLRARIAAFAAERDWEQFHNPKNLAMALAVEAGELLEHFQWLTPAQASDLPAGARRRGARVRGRVVVLAAAVRQTRHRPRRRRGPEAGTEREEVPGRQIARKDDEVQQTLT